MLFNSQAFILVFLPLALAAWYGTRSVPARQWLCILLSLAFYAWADIRFLPILIASIGFNWALATLIADRRSQAAVWIGVAGNLALLGYFKYRNFFLDSLLPLVGLDYQPIPLILPIGISFFTFQQISYLIDLRRGQSPLYGFREYAAFVSYFPHLIAGPIVRHNELIPLLGLDPRRDGIAERMGRGLVIFVIGLVKKFALADAFAPHANAVFAAAKTGAVTTLDAWTGTLSFTLQIYFDFSAYSDMAIGLAMMMGIAFPYNFASPYKAGSLRDFWRRWHMTLSRFLRDYLYIPLGGSRHGLRRHIQALILTMTICGFWHGAGWTFILWGLLHGIGLAVNTVWSRRNRPLPHWLGWLLTFLFVMLGWVLFRAENLTTAVTVWLAMAGWTEAGAIALSGFKAGHAAVALALALFAPNSQELAFDRWRPYRPLALGMAAALLFVLLEIGKGPPTEFIYFVF